jgi:predicted nucleic acid-binding protein
MSVLYLDSSALTKLVVTEPETASLSAAVRGKRLASSRVAVIEVTKAVARVDPEANVAALLDRLLFVELDAELAKTAAATGDPALRALDALHVASALRLGDELEWFVTYDPGQGTVARAAGLDVRAPDA